MNITIKNQVCRLPSTKKLKVLSPIHHSGKSLHDLAHKIYQNLPMFLIGKQNIVIIVNDATRNTRTDLVLSLLKPYIFNLQFTVLIATGTHPSPTDDEMMKILGTELEWIKPYVKIHDSSNDAMIYCGKTSFNNEILLNNIITGKDAIITINSVEPHYFAGFTGGRKSIVPGIASYQTIEKNHSLAMCKNAIICRLEGNPVNKDFEEAVSFLTQPIFSIQLVQNAKNEMIDLFCGDLNESFKNATELAKNIYQIPIKTRYDVIIAEVESPFDETFYQAHKALENSKSVLNKKGIFILLACCKYGIGNSKFVTYLQQYCSNSNRLSENYRLGLHKSYKIFQFLQKHTLWLVSNEKPFDIKHPNFHQTTFLQEAIDYCIRKCSNSFLHIKMAATTIPTKTD